jgi:hypothetical protein
MLCNILLKSIIYGIINAMKNKIYKHQEIIVSLELLIFFLKAVCNCNYAPAEHPPAATPAANPHENSAKPIIAQPAGPVTSTATNIPAITAPAIQLPPLTLFNSFKVN